MSDNLVFTPKAIYYWEETGHIAFPYSYRSGLDRRDPPANFIRRKGVTVNWEHRAPPVLKSNYTPVGSYYQEADGQWVGVIGPLDPDQVYMELGPFDTEDEARLHFTSVFELEGMDKRLREVPYP